MPGAKYAYVVPDDMFEKVMGHLSNTDESITDFITRAILETIKYDEIREYKNEIRGYGDMIDPVRVIFVLPKAERDELKRIALSKGISMSTFIRKAIKQAIEYDNVLKDRLTGDQ